MAIQSIAADSHLRSSLTMNLSALTPFSVTCWLNATSWAGGSRRSHIGIYGPSSDVALGAPVTALQIGTAGGANTIDCWTWGGGTIVSAAMPATTWNGVWAFITYTYDGTSHRVYRNGTLLNTTTTAQQPGFLNQVYINGYPGGGTSEVDNHQVDQYALYRRTLTLDEIQSIYNAQGARHGVFNGLICRYEFDEGANGTAATSVVDLTGNGHTLTFTGTGGPLAYTYSSTVANTNIRPVH